MNIDKDKFLFLYQESHFKALTDNQKSGLIALISFIESDVNMLDPRWVSYCLATAFHECAGTWMPIAEYGKGKGMKYGSPDVNGQVFYGRGFVQLTWAGNYKSMGKVCGVDLYNNPDLAMQSDIAYKIMSYGMRNGTFTGASLKQKIHDDVCDYVNARRIINGTDCANKIAGYAEKFEAILKESVAA